MQAIGIPAINPFEIVWIFSPKTPHSTKRNFFKAVSWGLTTPFRARILHLTTQRKTLCGHEVAYKHMNSLKPRKLERLSTWG